MCERPKSNMLGRLYQQLVQPLGTEWESDDSSQTASVEKVRIADGNLNL